MAEHRRMQVLLLLLLAACFWVSSAQQQQQQQQFPNSTCQGVLLTYKVKPPTQIPPFLSDARQQPFKFEADLTLTNMGFNEVKSWQAFIGFQHREWLVSASNSILSDGTILPAPVNDTLISGFPSTTLQNSIETAGDLTKTSVIINLVGTEFGVSPPDFPLPHNISFPVSGYTCGSVAKLGNDTLQLCCNENATAVDLSKSSDQFLPLESGDISIMYSVTQTFVGSYWAEVVISNENQFGRIDGWNLTWEWKQGEFISDMRGAQALDQDQIDCLNGPAGQHYNDKDFSTVMSCNKTPTFNDLPPEKFFDTTIGNVQSCCRSGVLLPKLMDPSKSKSVFQLEVFKLPPNTARDALQPPANFDLGPKYSCGAPRLVAPAEKPDPGNPLRTLSAVRSWQVVCNSTDDGNLKQLVSSSRSSCCVSFSGFYDSSAIPCPTCACGCSRDQNPVCDANAQALLIPPYALLTNFDNRSGITEEWASMNRVAIPKVKPCGDNCGININWHVLTDFEESWTARISILNWAGNVSDWFSAVELARAMPGLREVFTLNGTATNYGGSSSGVNNTLYIEGRDGYNDFLLAGQMVKNKLNPGKLQAVIVFDKKKTPGINVTGGDGFPSRIIFNGEECVLPSSLPTSGGLIRRPGFLFTVLLLILSLWIIA